MNYKSRWRFLSLISFLRSKKIMGFVEGGIVPGYGNNIDIVPASLKPGEIVLTENNHLNKDYKHGIRNELES